MKRPKPTARLRVGLVSAILHGECWTLRWTDPESGREVKRRLRGLERAEVEAIARHVTREAYAGRGYLARRSEVPSIAEGIAEALRLANTLEATRRERARRAAKFVKWLAQHYPAVRGWDQLRPAMLQAYVVEREQAGLAYDTVRLDVAPVKLAWRHMAENWPEHVRPLPRIKQRSAPPREIECLDPPEVAALLDWLRDHRPRLWPMATLQALAGLRMLEAAALREQDVDFQAGTVTVTDTGRHRPKTAASWRTIPVCSEVLEALRWAATRQRVRPATGELATDAKGDPWKLDALSCRWIAVLRRAARELGNSRLAAIPARKLRAAFTTMASRLDVPDRLLKAYLGHVPGDVLGSHYRRIEIKELRSVSGRIEGWRAALVRKESGNAPLAEKSDR